MAEILREYTALLEKNSNIAIEYVNNNRETINEIVDSDELILNAKVRYLLDYTSEFDKIKNDVIELENSYTSHSAIISNFLIKASGRLDLEEEKTLEAKLVNNATRFSIMYFITHKADQISKLSIKEQIEPQYLEFTKQLTEKALLKLSANEKSQLKNFLATPMERTDTSIKCFNTIEEML